MTAAAPNAIAEKFLKNKFGTLERRTAGKKPAART
jgi:hypothetical protein